MESLRLQYRRQWLIVAGVLAGCIVVAIVLGFPLQRVISNPILRLAKAAQTVSSKADFSIRVEKKSNDELGILYDGFNSMLSHIQERDAELERHRRHLEEMVGERTRTLESKTRELARSNAELAAQHATARALAECSSLSDAAPKILQAICESLGWDLGAIWSVDLQADLLRCVDTWHRPDVSVAKFEALTRSRTFSSGVGLPGRVWASGEPAWISDVTVDSNFPRAPIALEEGLHGAFGFPIQVSGSVVGVIEFFSHEIREPDDELLRMMASIGSQIGQFIERHRMQDRMMQSEKLASIGLLSAGVAHEINNPLAFVSNNLAVLERDNKGLMALVSVYEQARDRLSQVDPDSARQAQELADDLDLPYVRDNLDRVLTRTREGVQRVTRIVQSLRGLARTPSAQFEEAQLIDLINVSLEMIRGRLQRRGIVVDLECDPNLHLRCAASQVSQVLLNLFVNALQAIESKGHTENGHIRILGKRAGDEVLIEVADTGCGIDPNDLPRIFDPFFTTKPVGEGTGLGLSISHGIVTGHGGRFEINSQPGKGTSFRIFLPQTPKEPIHDDTH
jgi:signal transduction histidine kinase/HAMP domain-containing protein